MILIFVYDGNQLIVMTFYILYHFYFQLMDDGNSEVNLKTFSDAISKFDFILQSLSYSKLVETLFYIRNQKDESCKNIISNIKDVIVKQVIRRGLYFFDYDNFNESNLFCSGHSYLALKYIFYLLALQ